MSGRRGRAPRWHESDEHEDPQDDGTPYDYPVDSTEEMMDFNVDDNGGNSMSDREYDVVDAETSPGHDLNNYSSHDPFTVAQDTNLAVNTQDHAFGYHGYSGNFDLPTTSSSSFVPGFPLRRAGTMNTDSSMRPYQGSEYDSDSDDGRQDARRRDPVHLADAYDRHDPPLPPGHRQIYRSTGAGGIFDIRFDANMPDETTEKKGKRRKDKETSDSFDNSSTSRHRKKPRDDDERDPSRKHRSSKTPRH